MSIDATDTTTDSPDDRLDALYEVRDDLELIAESDVPYAEDAQNFLAALEEAGYDV